MYTAAPDLRAKASATADGMDEFVEIVDNALTETVELRPLWILEAVVAVKWAQDGAAKDQAALVR